MEECFICFEKGGCKVCKCNTIVHTECLQKFLEISENLRNQVAEKACLLNLEGVRAELGVLRTVRCSAAWRGEKTVSEEDVEEVIVDQSVVKNNTEPLIIHSKGKKTSAA